MMTEMYNIMYSTFNPINRIEITKERRVTDVYFIPLFGVIFLSWLSIGSYAMSSEPQECGIDDDFCINMEISSRMMKKWAIGILVSTIVNAVIMHTHVYLVKNATRKCCIAAVINIIITLIRIIFTIAYAFVDDGFLLNDTFFFFIFISFLSIEVIHALYLITVILALKKTNSNNIIELVKESNRIILNCPSTVIFSSFVYLLTIALSTFTIITFKSLIHFDMSDQILAFHCINLIGGIFMISFTLNFGLMVIAQCVVNACWTLEGSKMSSLEILRSMARTLKYHVGTITLASVPFLSLLYGLIIALMPRPESPREDENLLIKISSRLSLIYNSSNFSLIHTAIRGCSFKDSLHKMFGLVPCNSALFLTSIEINKNVIDVGTILMTIFWAIVFYGILHVSFVTAIMVPAVLSSSLIFYVLMDTNLKTLLVYELILRHPLEKQNEQFENLNEKIDNV